MCQTSRLCICGDIESMLSFQNVTPWKLRDFISKIEETATHFRICHFCTTTPLFLNRSLSSSLSRYFDRVSENLTGMVCIVLAILGTKRVQPLYAIFEAVALIKIRLCQRFVYVVCLVVLCM